jgi:DNA helicase-2/ATP-dependent DNA helicase PcrA
MSALNHPDYNNELKNLSYTLKYINGYNEKVQKEKSKIDKEVEYSIRHYNSDNAEQYNELLINSTLQESLEQRLKNLNKSMVKPYFARVDFIEDGTDIVQKLYIGKISLLRNEDQELIIIDWRAPVATLYYEGRLGNGLYKSTEGEIQGQIKLKRQYTIESAELKEIYDIDITTNDEFLQAALGSSKDKRLKDIVSTIQAEQNQVIRADMWKSLVVQGAAGGGKTTIALHRIAYLLYNYEKTLSPKNFMIIAPNRFFLSYISEVLPDLGVENVLQTTFEDFAINIIGKKLKLKNPYDKLSILVSNKDSKSNQIKRISSIKSSLDFKNVLEDYINVIERSFVPKEDFKIGSFILIEYERINTFFCKDYKHLPMIHRINEIKKTLVNTLKQKKGPIIEEIESEYDRKIETARVNMEDSPDRRMLIIELADTRDMLIEKVKKHSKTIIKEYLSKFTTLSPLEYYKQLLSDKVLFCNLCSPYIDEAIAEQIRVDSLYNLNKNEIDLEDLAPLMYMKYMINGLQEKLDVRHVVIDEAQDFSEFQLFILKKLIGGNSFTILGDLCQGIYSYRGINDWESVSENIFGKDNYSMLTLEQSYRTTIEIMEAANSVIKFLNDSKLPPSKPVIRHGEEVKVIEKSSLKEVASTIAAQISRFKEDGFKSAAIICKTLQECKELKADLKGYGLNLKIINGNENEYSGGLVLIPSYLVKGLEFDVVIIANASKNEYSTDPLDVKLLYIAMTRPLHRLYIYSAGEKTRMLSELKEAN